MPMYLNWGKKLSAHNLDRGVHVCPSITETVLFDPTDAQSGPGRPGLTDP